MNYLYFWPLKKTGPPVETGRPLRLLDMRLFNCIVCAETTTACNGNGLIKHPLSQILRSTIPFV